MDGARDWSVCVIVEEVNGAWGFGVVMYLILEVFSPGRHACDG